MLKKIFTMVLLVPLLTGVKAVAQKQVPHPANTPLADIIGLMHSSGKYRFTTSNFMKEGVDEIVNMGTHVIKLFFGANARNAYPSFWGCDWDTYNFTNLTELAQTPYFADAFSRPQLKTYILSAHEMSNGGSITNFKNGLSVAEKNNLYNELYSLTTYLYNTYNGTGKTFVLANWEGDGILGFVDRQNNLPPADTAQMWLDGFKEWLNIRQDAITDARNAAIAAGKANVMVAGAAECNHVSVLKEYDWPTMIDEVIPYTHMDLYSFSNWKTNKPSTVDDFDSTLSYIKAKAPDSELFGADNIYLGEIGTFELVNLVGNIPAHTSESDRVAREVMQRNIEYALNFGIRYIAHWQIFDNGLRSGVVLPPGQNAVESQLTGTGIRRADGSYSGTYNYYKSIMATTIGDYINRYEAEAQVTAVSAGITHTDTRFNAASGEYFSRLNATAVNDTIRYAVHVSQTGDCVVKMNVRKGPSYGIVQLLVNGVALDTIVDCYNSGSNIFITHDMGIRHFDSAGVYQFACVVKGKSGSAYNLGVDYFELTPATLQTQTISFDPLQARQANGPVIRLRATASSHLPVNYTSSDTTIAIVSGAGTSFYIKMKKPGVSVITAAQAGGNGYLPATSVSRNLLVLDSAVVADTSFVVDNTTAGFSTMGTWSVSASSADRYGANYAFDGTSAADIAKWAKWTPDVAVAGVYRVDMIWNGGSSRVKNAPVTVVHAAGTDSSLRVDQQFRSGSWNTMGEYVFEPGTAHYVQIHASAPGYTIADAVRFTLVQLAVPQMVSVSDSGVGGAVIRWHSVPGVTGYHVYHAALEDGPFTRLTVAPVTDTGYWGSAGVAGHYFRVSAVSVYGESPLSAAMATPPAASESLLPLQSFAAGGLNTTKDQQQVVLYPNPARDQVSIRMPQSGIRKFVITNMSGQIVHVENGLDNQTYHNFPVHYLSAGTYLLVGWSANGKISFKQKLVILR